MTCLGIVTDNEKRWIPYSNWDNYYNYELGNIDYKEYPD
jgi:hypothetical protein